MHVLHAGWYQKTLGFLNIEILTTSSLSCLSIVYVSVYNDIPNVIKDIGAIVSCDEAIGLYRVT